eukprot:scaffold5779_cov108-Isochrysis_galbana.AAC.3
MARSSSRVLRRGAKSSRSIRRPVVHAAADLTPVPGELSGPAPRGEAVGWLVTRPKAYPSGPSASRSSTTSRRISGWESSTLPRRRAARSSDRRSEGEERLQPAEQAEGGVRVKARGGRRQRLARRRPQRLHHSGSHVQTGGPVRDAATAVRRTAAVGPPRHVETAPTAQRSHRPLGHALSQLVRRGEGVQRRPLDGGPLAARQVVLDGAGRCEQRAVCRLDVVPPRRTE